MQNVKNIAFSISNNIKYGKCKKCCFFNFQLWKMSKKWLFQFSIKLNMDWTKYTLTFVVPKI